MTWITGLGSLFYLCVLGLLFFMCSLCIGLCAAVYAVCLSFMHVCLDLFVVGLYVFCFSAVFIIHFSVPDRYTIHM